MSAGIVVCWVFPTLPSALRKKKSFCVCQGGGSPLQCVASGKGVVRTKVQPTVNKHDLL